MIRHLRWSMVPFAVLILVHAVWATDDYEEPEVSDFDRDHWSFRPLVRPEVPKADHQGQRNAVDCFIHEQLHANTGLNLAPEADRLKLVRRVHFDLIGLPPSRDAVRQFLDDDAPDAYERLVDRLLSSPEYGPRWAQFWLDLARFAETDGFEHDKVRKNAWRYRDWVIDAFNADMPYDQFVQWQIAGDVLAPDDPQAHLATAFCLSGPDMPDINLQEERKHVLLNEITSTVGATLLGLQVGCAQCHDHMYDPISQADFYRLRAFFDPAVQLERNKSIGLLAKQPATSEPSRMMIRGDFRRPGPRVRPAFLRVIAQQQSSDTPLSRSDLAKWLTRADHPLTARVIVNRVWQFHFGRGISETPSDFGVIGSEPTHPDLLDWLATEFVASGWQMKRLHRLLLTSATYRQQGERPSSAAERRRWEAALDKDPDNTWFSRFPRRRLEAEVIRDSMYAVSDSLNDKMSGPGVRPPLPSELVSTLLKNQWNPTKDKSEHYRRSIYIFARRNLRFPLLAMFDRPSANNSCACRQTSTTSPQSLLMLNSAASLDAARRLAGAVWKEGGTATTQIANAVQRAYGRPVKSNELRALADFIAGQTQLLAAHDPKSLAIPIPPPSQGGHDASAAALTDLCLALLNANEFIYLD